MRSNYFLVFLVSIVSSATLSVREYEERLDTFLNELYEDFRPFFLNSHGGEESATEYLNEWVVYVPEGSFKANELANETGYENMGSVRRTSPII